MDEANVSAAWQLHDGRGRQVFSHRYMLAGP